MDSSTVCTVCKKQESDYSKIISCKNCCESAHLTCRNLSKKAASRLKNSSYFCSDSCASHFKQLVCKNSTESSIVASVTSELKSVVSIEMLSMREEMKSLATAIESSQEFLSSKFEEILRDFALIKKENVMLKQELEVLKHSQASLKTSLNKLEMHVDNAHKEKKLNNLVFLGVPPLPYENVRDLTAKISSAVGVQLNSDDVVAATRIGSTNSANSLPPVRVEFKRNSVKEALLEKKKQFGVLLSTQINENLLFNQQPTKITVRNELTPFSLQLLRYVRAQQKDLGWKYVWVGRGGSILVKVEERSKTEIIRSHDDLDKLIRQFGGQSLKSSNMYN